MKKVLVTGGAGFIGSHLVDALMRCGFSVTVFDNLSSGSLDNVAVWVQNPSFRFIRKDLLDLKQKDAVDVLDGVEYVFHLAANPEVKVGSTEPSIHLRENVSATFNLLEALRLNCWRGTFVFTSSSTVYGEAETATPEDYPLLRPISVYGASKLACEALIMAYARSFGFKALIYRLANVVGSRSKHGVIVDFVRKLRENPLELEILGDGAQKKSYVHISDCVEALLLGLNENFPSEVFNVGSTDQIDVLSIAKIVAREMGLENVRLKFTGGVDGGRGWIGDVKNMLLDVSRIGKFGWKPRLSSAEAVSLAAREILREHCVSR